VISLVPFAPSPPTGPLFSAWPRVGWYEWRVRLLLSLDDLARADRAARDAEAAGLTELAPRLRREVEAGRQSGRGLGEVERARQLLGAGREREGLRALERAVEIDPANSGTWVMLANQRRLAGDLAGAEQALARGRTSDRPEVQAQSAMVAGLIAIDRRQPLAAAQRFQEAQRWSPKLAKGYLLEARALLVAGDRSGPRAAVARGLGAVPGDQDLRSMMAELGPGP